MDLIIDGYNLLALDRRLDRGLEQSRNSLINHLVRYRQVKALNLTVVFDGWRSGSATETRLAQDGISIVYSRLGEKADAVVIRLAREKSSGAVVVSSDREIRNAVERFGAVAIHAQEFNDILQELDFPGGEDGFDDWQDRPSDRTRANRLSKADRKRQDKLRKLRL
jgi:predicted RNA-binding protein with PIN domain